MALLVNLIGIGVFSEGSMTKELTNLEIAVFPSVKANLIPENKHHKKIRIKNKKCDTPSIVLPIHSCPEYQIMF